MTISNTETINSHVNTFKPRQYSCCMPPLPILYSLLLSMWLGWSGKICSVCTLAHSSNQYQYPTDIQKQLLPRELLSCQQMGILAACQRGQRGYIKTNFCWETQQYGVILSLHKWFIQTQGSVLYKVSGKNRGKECKDLTWLKNFTQRALDLT